MLHVALLEPEIPGNTGSAARTCLAAGATLHLIRPLGFFLTEAALRRAGLDYWPSANVVVHESYALFAERFAGRFAENRVLAFSTRAGTPYTEAAFRVGDVLLFGPESRGLPEELLRLLPCLRIPMQPAVRSLNLAAAVAVGLFEARRQLGWGPAEGP